MRKRKIKKIKNGILHSYGLWEQIIMGDRALQKSDLCAVRLFSYSPLDMRGQFYYIYGDGHITPKKRKIGLGALLWKKQSFR
ncbi:MAG: hypothetical protein LBH93_07185, partial [Chitinispirillales bacterium]|nr:hypothetical protein [Chitinispirillales bacterium]